MAIKRDALHAVFSNCIRLAAGCCERCHKKGRLENSHFIGRRSKSVRWFPNNCTATCGGCHRFFGEHPFEHTIFMQLKLGLGVFDDLVRRGKIARKYTTQDRKEMRAHYKEELKRIQALRDNGFEQDLILIPWD